MKRIKMIAKKVNRVIVNPQQQAKKRDQNKQNLQAKHPTSKSDNTTNNSGRKRSPEMEARLERRDKKEIENRKIRTHYKEKIKQAIGKDAKDKLRKERDNLIAKNNKDYTDSYKNKNNKETSGGYRDKIRGRRISAGHQRNKFNENMTKYQSAGKNDLAPAKKPSWWKRAINKIKGYFK